MQFEVLGPVRVVDGDGIALTLASASQRRLMSLLVLNAGTVVSADLLEEHLGLSGGALRTAVSRLRRIVGADVLITAPPGYELRTERVDAIEFERFLTARNRVDLEAGLALWRGDAYAEFDHEEWAITEANRLTTLRSGAVEDLVEMMVDAREWTAAIATIEPLIEREPFRDRPRELLMRALAGSGRRTDALRAFQAYRTFLVEEIGTEPSAAVVALDREIAGGEDPDVHVGALAPFDAPAVFVMTDIVGSTRMWLASPETMSSDLMVHDEIVRRAIDAHGGVTIATAGDSFTAAFERAVDAVNAAIALQRSLAAAEWQSTAGISVRAGVHLGIAQRRGFGWYGSPLNETARMMATAHGGQIVVSEAVAEQLSDVDLVDLGEHRLRDIVGVRRLFQVGAEGLVSEFPSLRSHGSYVTTLPAQRTVLIGRETLISEIRGRLIGHALVSLIGPGGVGKTRAAVEAAGRELASFDDGVFFIDLTTAAAPDDVLGAFVSGVRATLSPGSGAEVALVEHLRERHALLVVDNCEHVVDAAAEVIDSLLSQAPDIHVLATSREALRVPGEQCVSVPPLDVDGPESPGVRLLVERAGAAGAVDAFGGDALSIVVEIAGRLDGIPLALELAAAQLTTLSPGQILEHLDDRFRLLTKGRRPAPERQRTLEGAIAWSYELLEEHERLVFRSLAICAGPFSLGTVARLLLVDELEAATAVDVLAAKCLITPIRYDDDEGGAWTYLESLREFGRRALSEAGESEAAQMALEAALLPPEGLHSDWNGLVNQYFSAGDRALVVEDATRRDAAVRALDGARLDAAALILSSCAFRDTPGELDAMLALVGPLAERRDELEPLGWRAAMVTKLLLERLTRRFGECFETAIAMLDALDDDDPTRGWFDLWRCALTTSIAPEAGLSEIDAVLDEVRATAVAPYDWTLSQYLVCRATGLVMLRDLDGARVDAEEGLSWAGIGRESLDQAIAMVLWIAYLRDDVSDEAVHDLVARQSQELGLAELCAAPGALCTGGTFDGRVARLVAAARRRPPNDVCTPFLLAFGWLAVEDGDPVHAAELAAVAEIYDASTQVALVYLLARVHGWTDETWATERDAAIAAFLQLEHEAESRKGPATLNAEIEAWERRLAAQRAEAS